MSKVKKKKDFLDILRFLNRDNINDNPDVRDSFFKSLMIYYDDVPDYLDSLSDAYYVEFDKKYVNNLARYYLIASVLSKSIESQLSDHLIEDRGNGLYISGKNAANVVMYVGSIKGIKKLIEKDSVHFDFFKQKLLMGLIIRYAKDYVSGREKDITRLNKLVSLYVEHVKELEIDENMILDDDFLKKLKNYKNTLGLDDIDIEKEVNRFVSRKYSSLDELGYERKY